MWVTVVHPELGLTAKVTKRAWVQVHSKPENGGWELAEDVGDEEE